MRPRTRRALRLAGVALGGLVAGCEADVGTQPTRFLLAWVRLTESESYREPERFRRHSRLRGLMDRIREAVVPLAPSTTGWS